jgi:plastocyanin
MGAGNCQHATLGMGLTLQAFNAGLRETRSVAAWKIEPVTISLKAGTRIMLLNSGGQAHTYTEVAEFGGGAVPELNQLSGNPDVAPECANAATVRASGMFAGQVRMQAFDRAGPAKYQCCIHPWMRQTVTVF